MVEFDLEAACLIRLRQELGALLAHAEPTCRERIMAMVCRRPREGLEIMPQLRAALGPRLQRWPWPDDAVHGDHTGPADDAGLAVEPLADPPLATLWPHRPKREPDELFSSWLWRIARGLGAPPKRFAREAVGACLADIDRDISDTAIGRLAFLSGQTREHLLRGTMRPDVTADPAGLRGRVQQRLLRRADDPVLSGVPAPRPCLSAARLAVQPGGCLLRRWLLSARRLLAVRRLAGPLGADRAVRRIPLYPVRRAARQGTKPVDARQRRRAGRIVRGVGSPGSETQQPARLVRL